MTRPGVLKSGTTYAFERKRIVAQCVTCGSELHPERAKKYDYCMLFKAHLEGQLPKPNPAVPSIFYDTFREKVALDFQADRLIVNLIHGNSLQQLEEQQQQIQQRINEMAATLEGELPRSELILDRKMEINNLLINIRERVEAFIIDVESDSSDVTKTSQIGGGESPMKKNGKIFIGHGRSEVWRVLKDLIQDRLHLEWDEFNRESPAGIPTADRLQEMIKSASFAFLVMTAEDEHADKTLHARENVIHEIGLFQGKLTFRRAIVLLEDGCTEFSNIHGVNQIRFPQGNILAKSEEIRRVLEREGILSPAVS